MRIWLGVDPGIKGAIAGVDDDGKLIDIRECPTLTMGKKRITDEAGIGELLRKLNESLDVEIGKVGIEKVHAYPAIGLDNEPCPTCGGGRAARGVVSTWTLAENFALWKGVCAGIPIPYELLTPQRWRALLIRDTPPEATTKQASALIASRLWPRGAFGKRLTQDFAEAALIAEATRRIFMGI